MDAAALWLVAFGILDATTGVIVLWLFSLAPPIAATVVDERRTAVFAAAAVALAFGAGWWHGLTGGVTYWNPGCGGLCHQCDGGRGGGYVPPPRGAPGADERDR
jgi:hypothetical protein